MTEIKMSVSDRVAAAVPHLQTVLDDPEVQDALRRTASAGRQTYRRARGKSPGKAVGDGYGVYFVSSADGREALRNLINHDASSQSSTAQ